jgi:cyclase
VKSVKDAQSLLEAGADKVAVNTAAVRSPELLEQLADQFGSQCVILALDARSSSKTQSGYEVVVSSGKEPTGIDAALWAKECGSRGIGEIVLTSFDRDGTGDGYDLRLINAISSAVTVPVIASGGAGKIEDMVAAFNEGADAVLAASLFHYDRLTVNQAKTALAESGIVMRLKGD